MSLLLGTFRGVSARERRTVTKAASPRPKIHPRRTACLGHTCGVMNRMTPESDDSLSWLGAAVDEAIPPQLRLEWDRHVARAPVLVARQGIFTEHGRAFAYQLSFRSPGHRLENPSAWSARQHEEATAHVLDATFGRADLEDVAQGRLLFVRCPRAYLVGELRVPHRPDRLVIEVSDSVDPAVIERQLLPLVDFVKIDVRDLDVEGRPVVRAARSYGALVVGEYVERPEQLQHARELGVNLFQGNLLERAGVLDRADARPVVP